MNKKILTLSLAGCLIAGGAFAQTAPAALAPALEAPIAVPAAVAPPSSYNNVSDDMLIRGAARKKVLQDSLTSDANLIAAQGKVEQAKLKNNLDVSKLNADLTKSSQPVVQAGSKGVASTAAPVQEVSPVLYAIYGSGSNMVAEIFFGSTKWIAKQGSVSHLGDRVVSITDNQVTMLDKKGRKKVLNVAGSAGI